MEMEGAHERESTGLRQDHEREQSEMTDPIFESAAVAVLGNSHGDEGDKGDSLRLWNWAAVATVEAAATNKTPPPPPEKNRPGPSTNFAEKKSGTS